MSQVPAVRRYDRAILNRDVIEFKDAFALTSNQLMRVLGITGAFLSLCRKAPEEPVKDVSVALIIRLYRRHPELVDSPTLFSIASWWQSIGGEKAIKKRLLSVLFGRDANAGYAWLDKQTPLTPRLYTLVKLVANYLPETGIRELYEEGSLEAEKRGVSPFLTGCWTVPADGRPATIPFEDLGPTSENTRRGRRPTKRLKKKRKVID